MYEPSLVMLGAVRHPRKLNTSLSQSGNTRNERRVTVQQVLRTLDYKPSPSQSRDSAFARVESETRPNVMWAQARGTKAAQLQAPLLTIASPLAITLRYLSVSVEYDVIQKASST